jgi:adenine deaminase
LVHPRVLGLAEVMDFPSVRDLQSEMIDKLIMAANTSHARIYGHAAGLNFTGLNIYRAAGIGTDHECVTAEEAKERLQRSMYVLIREGSVAKNLLSLIPAVTEQNARRCLFVTDDKHLDDLMDEGSIDYMVRLAIDQVISPMTAIRMATLNTAECFHLAHIGAIAPGYQADFLLLDDLQKVAISEVYKNGQCVARNGEILPAISAQVTVTDYSTIPLSITNSVNLPPLSKDQLTIPLESSRAHVIEMIPNSLYTRHLIEEVMKVDNRFVSSVRSDLLKIAVIERHHQTGPYRTGNYEGVGLAKRGHCFDRCA